MFTSSLPRFQHSTDCKVQSLIFDFDGTVADTSFLALDILEKLRGQSFSEEQLNRLRDKSSKEVLRELNIGTLELLKLLYLGRRNMHKRLDEIQPIPGLNQVLHDLKAKGIQLFVVTSNSRKNVQRFFAGRHLENPFSDVCSSFSLFNKHQKIRSLIRKRGFDPSKVLYVGDETRDIDAAKRVGMPSVAVTWGFNSRSALEQHRPNYICERPDQLHAIVQSASMSDVKH